MPSNDFNADDFPALPDLPDDFPCLPDFADDFPCLGDLPGFSDVAFPDDFNEQLEQTIDFK